MFSPVSFVKVAARLSWNSADYFFSHSISSVRELSYNLSRISRLGSPAVFANVMCGLGWLFKVQLWNFKWFCDQNYV